MVKRRSCYLPHLGSNPYYKKFSPYGSIGVSKIPTISSDLSSQRWDETFLNISNPKGLGQMIIPNVVGHLVVFSQKVHNPNTIGLDTLD